MICRAIGAAALAPKPPCSTTTATAMRGSSAGAKAMNSDWWRRFSGRLCGSRRRLFLLLTTCAVPVLPPMM